MTTPILNSMRMSEAQENTSSAVAILAQFVRLPLRRFLLYCFLLPLPAPGPYALWQAQGLVSKHPGQACFDGGIVNSAGLAHSCPVLLASVHGSVVGPWRLPYGSPPFGEARWRQAQYWIYWTHMAVEVSDLSRRPVMIWWK